MEKNSKIVYDANGVHFTIYPTTKHILSGPTTYRVLEDYSTGKRRLLNNPTELAARQRADQIRAAMAKGQASRLALNNGRWQDISPVLEIVRSTDTGNSLSTVAREWAECDGMLGGRATLLETVKFFLANHREGGPRPKPIAFADAAKAYHSFKVRSGKSGSHCGNIHSRLSRLGKTLPPNVKLDELTGGQLDNAGSNRHVVHGLRLPVICRSGASGSCHGPRTWRL